MTILIPKTYIHEFPHPRTVVHYHPVADEQLALRHIQFALALAVHAIELDLHYREDGQIVANHDSATADSPTLGQVIQMIIEHANGAATLNHDDRQFFLVLDLKEDDLRLFRGALEVLSGYAPYLSTAVSQGGPPRGITVVITGDYVRQFAAQIEPGQRNQLCIVEGYQYGEEIVNLSEGQIPFQWAEALQHPGERGRVNALHAGVDPLLRGRYNVRVWDCRNAAELSAGLASGADAVNADRDQVELLERLIGNQAPRGEHPALSIRGAQVLAAWCTPGSHELYMALGSLGAGGLRFPRQILLPSFLGQAPPALAPAAALCPDRRLLIAFHEPDRQQLWYICGSFASGDRFLTFDGRPRRLALPHAALGSRPAVAVGAHGRMVLAYECAEEQTIWYVSGFLNAAGELIGRAHRLAEGTAPAVAIDPGQRIVVAYSGLGQDICYLAGAIDGVGKLVGDAFSLAEVGVRCGGAPSVACGAHGRVIVACQGTDAATLQFVSGTLDDRGLIVGQEFALAAARRGRHPAIACADTGDIVLLYEALGDQTCRYIHGRLDGFGRLDGRERALEVGMDRR